MNAKREVLIGVLLLGTACLPVGTAVWLMGTGEARGQIAWEEEGPILVSPPNPTGIPSQGNMATSPEFTNIKTLWSALVKLNPSTKDELEESRKSYQSQLDNHLKALEAKSLSGRWVRNFFVSEVDNFFLDLSRYKKLVAEKTATEEERTTLFWQELNFCFEGFRTLDTFKEYDAWLSDLLENRCRRAFRIINGISFKKRLDQLKQTADQYKETLTKLIDNAYDYRQKTRPNAPPVLVGKARDELTDVLVRLPKGSWAAHNTRKDREFFESDLVEVKAKEDREVILMDRRYLKLEGEAILAGWELTPQIPETLNKDIAHLIELLNNDDWLTREKATEELMAIGEPAIPALKEAQKSPEPEVRMRANLILKKIEKGDIDQQVRNLVAPYLPQGRYPPYDQLMQLGTKEQIIPIVQAMMNEKQQNSQEWAMLRSLLQMLQRGRRW